MNIKTLAELLSEFISAEKEILEGQNIVHRPTIGKMYEGLTAEILNSPIFEQLKLKVVRNSFINGCDTEFDVLLVENDGKKIPYTDSLVFDPLQVIAVIQVKKNLFSKDIAEGYDNLRALHRYYPLKKVDGYEYNLFRDSFRGICKKPISFKGLNDNEGHIYNSIKHDVLTPIRIIYGYNGFKNELNFREAYAKYIKQNTSIDVHNLVSGYGPHSFPNLIICDGYSLIKNNGLPFTYPILAKGWWPFYTSSSYNPTYFFLEVIWSRLSYRFKLPDSIFGDDLSMEPINRFIDCRIIKVGEIFGWEYNYVVASKATLLANTEIGDWQPVELDEKQFTLISELCTNGEIDIEDPNLESFIIEGGLYDSFQEFLEKINSTGLIYIEDNKMKLLTDLCQTCIMPDGRYMAGDNKSGRLTNWLKNEIKEKPESNNHFDLF